MRTPTSAKRWCSRSRGRAWSRTTTTSIGAPRSSSCPRCYRCSSSESRSSAFVFCPTVLPSYLFSMRPTVLTALLALSLTACDKLPTRPKTAFNADSAWSYTQQQVNFVPRVPGTPAAPQARDLIVAMINPSADTVIEQRWVHRTAKGDSLPLRNILARFRPQATQRILYVTHWDTRPMADSDPVLGHRNTPILGANDGASGVGLFIALGDALKKTPPNVGVDLLFVDGEDYGVSFNPPYVDVLLGSHDFVSHLPAPDYKPRYDALRDRFSHRYPNLLHDVS